MQRSGNPGAAIILISLLLLMGLFTRSSWSYQTDLKLQPCAEVVVKLLQTENNNGTSPIPRWGLCSTGDPADPGRLYLCKYGPKALPLFNLATRYPIRTYLGQTPFEYNLRFLVTHELEARAKLEEDKKRLKESREKFKALLKDLGIEKSFRDNPFYQEMFTGLNTPRGLETAAGEPPQSLSQEKKLSTDLEMSAVTTVLGGNGPVRTGTIQGADVVRRGATGVANSVSLLSGRRGPARDLAIAKTRGPLVSREGSDWIDKVFGTIMAAIHWFTHNLDIIGIVLGLFLLFGLFARK